MSSFWSQQHGSTKLRIGYIPEHFSTPLHFAQKHYGLSASLIPFPKGTGDLTAALKTSSPEDGIDVAIGLTEGFIADLGRSRTAGSEPGYGLVGTYVESPLCWAISTGADRSDVNGVRDLRQGKKVGVSRIGSGSYVMSYVLADQQGWLGGGEGEQQQSGSPFEVVPCGDINALTSAVSSDAKADFFMWEHFTTKYLWDRGTLKKIGEIYTPWPSWMIAAREPADGALEALADKLNAGLKHYAENPEEAVELISGTMHYSKDDARAWMNNVRFSDDVRGVAPEVVDKTVALLRKAGVLEESAGGSDHMIVVKRAASGGAS